MFSLASINSLLTHNCIVWVGSNVTTLFTYTLYSYLSKRQKYKGIPVTAQFTWFIIYSVPVFQTELRNLSKII